MLIHFHLNKSFRSNSLNIYRPAEEVFNWILEAAEEAGDHWDGGRVVWILRYVIEPSADENWMKKDPFTNFGDERHKLTTRLEIQKDDIQAVMPIAKVLEPIDYSLFLQKNAPILSDTGGWW